MKCDPNLYIFLIVTIKCVLGDQQQVLTGANNGIDNSTEMYLVDSTKILSRRRRYVAFPEGSSFSVRILLIISSKN